MKKAARILIVEDISADAELAEREICKVLKGSTFQRVETRKDFLRALETFQPDVILSDYVLSRFDGLTALKLSRKHAPFIPLIIWTGSNSEEIAVDCLKAGANNYVLKENTKRLGPAVLRAVEERKLLLARQQAEEKYQTIFENSIVGIFQSTPQGRYCYVNAAMARIYGYDSPQEMIEAIQDIKQQIYVDANRRSDFLKLLGAQNTVEHFEERNYRKDHSIIWTSTSARAVRDSDGNSLYYEGFITDITARKKAEEELKDRERQLTTLFGNLPGPVYRCQNDAKYTMDFISDGIQELSGYPADDFRQHRRDYGKLIHPADKVRVWADIQAAVERNQPFELTYRILTASNEEKWVREKGQGVYDANGQLQALEGFITDITKRKQAEETLQNNEKRYRALFEDLPISIWEEDYSEVKAHIDSLKQQGITDFREYFAHPNAVIECADGIRVIGVNNTTLKMYHAEDKDDLLKKINQGLSATQMQYLRAAFISIADGKTSFAWDGTDETVTGKPIEVNIAASVVPGYENDLAKVIVVITDISERKQAEEAVRNSEKRFRALIENGLDDISLLAADGTLLWESPSTTRNLGYPPGEYLAHNIFEIMHPEDLAWTRNVFARLTQEPGGRESGMFRLRHSDGTWRWVEAIATNFLNEPSVDAIVINYRDITERKRAEEKLRQSENRYRLAIKATNDVIWEMNLQAKQLYWSENAQTVFGYSPEEVASYETWWEDHVHTDDRERVLSKIDGLIERDETLWKDEYRFQLKSGSYAYVSDRGYIERDANGTPLRMIGAMTDITERKQAEDRLRESENRLFMALSGAQMSVWEWDLKTNQILWSPEFFRITGVDEEQFTGNFDSFADLIHHDDVRRVRNAAEKAVKEQTLFAEEFRIICPDGEVRWLSNLGQAEYDLTGSHLRLIGTVQDVTQRKQAEIERQALLEIMQGLAHTADLQELLKLIHHSIARVVYARNFFVVLYQPDTGLFEEIYSVDQYDPPAAPDKLENSITSYVFRLGEPLLLTQALFDELVRQGEMKLVGTNSASWLGVPLKTSGRTIGVIAVQDYESDNRYTERDKQFLASIASQVALAIERRRADIELQQKNDDLGLLNAINQAMIQGQNLDAIVELLAKELSRIFSVEGSTIYSTLYMLSPDKQSIRMQKYFFSEETERRIEKLIGFRIPTIEIPAKEGGHFHRALVSGRSALQTESKAIRDWIAEFTETSFLHPFARAAVRKLVPQIQKLLNIRSVIIVPLIYEEEIIGFWDVSSSGLLTANDQNRIEQIGGQLTAVIQRQQINEKIRGSEEFLQGVQNALSANIAILDENGMIIQVNSAWREFGTQNGLVHPNACIGLNYLDICDSATGSNAEEAASVAQAIRAIMAGESGEALVEYPCHAPDTQRWFALHITKFEDGDHTWVVLAHEDITERKQVERSLTLFRSLIDHSNDVIEVADPETGRFLDVNEQACRAHGYTREEYLALTVDDIDPLARTQPQLISGELYRSGSLVFESTHRRKDGSVFPVEVTLNHISLDRRYNLSVVRDITERKRAEQALRESEEHYRAIFEGVQDAIFVESLDGKIITVNQRACEMFGYSYEQFLTKTVQDLVPEGSLILTAEGGNSLLSPEPHETFNRRANGEIFPIDISGGLQIINGEKVLLVVVRDITERKKSEELLRESEDRFSSAFKYASIGMALVSPEGRWLRVNWALCELVGYSQKELSQKSFQDITYADDLDKDLVYVQKVLAGEIDSYEMEKRYIHKSGKIIWVLLSASLVRDNEGQPLYFISQIQDITERKEAEDALHRSEALYRRAMEVAGAVPYYETYHDEDSSIKYEFIGEGIRQITGFGPQEFNATIWDSLVEEINLVGELAGHSLEEAIRRVRAGENSIWTCEHRLRDRDGNIHWVFEAAVELRDENGISYGSIGTYQDITERKLAEEALREAETKYRTLVEQLPSVTYLDAMDDSVLTGEFNTSYISPQVDKLLGYPPHAFQTDPALWARLIHPDDRERVLARIQEYYKNRGFYSDEYRMRTRTGNEIWIRDEAIIVRGNGNKNPFSQGVIFDITERKRMEVAEREQRALAEALRDTAEILNSTLDYGEVLDHILITAGRVVPHDAATIMLIEGESARVVRSRGYNQRGFNAELIGITLPLAETSNLQQMLTAGQPEVVSDTWTYAGWKSLSFTDWLRSNVGAPILISGEVIGFILLDSGTPGFFTPVHAERLEAFANQAALAIHNARLLQQAQEEIAERKRAEEALRLEKERLESIATTVPGIICSFRLRPDGSGCMPFASPAIQDVYGFMPADLLEDITPVFARIHAEDLPHVNASIQESAETMIPWHDEFRYSHPIKGEVWIEGQSMPLREEDGSTIWHGFIHDVTERKRAEEELRASEERFRQLADNIQEVFWMTDARSGEEIYMSPAAETIWGLPLEILLQEPNTFLNSVFPEDQPWVLQNIEKEQNGERVEMEYRIVRPNGSLRWIWDRAFPIFDDAGKVKSIAGISADITERKQAEDEIRRRAEETSILLKTSLALTNLDLNATLQTVSDSARNLFAADGCRIFLMEPDGKSLRCVLALRETAFSDLTIRVGEGVTGAVAASGLSEIVNDMKNDARAVQVAGTLEEEEAIMFAPLKERDNTIGVLSVRRIGKNRPFQLADLALLEALASMAASAVSNARLFAETQRRLSELEALYENGLAVGRLLKPNEIGKRLIHTFANYLPWHHVTIRLRHDAGDDLELVAFSLPNLKEEERANAEQHFIARINKVGQGLSGWVIQTGNPLRTGNVHAYPQYIDTHAGIQSGLYMPLKAGERVIGVITVESELPDAFTEQDERLLATLASQAAIAFENARLYQAIEQELSERKRAEEAVRTSETHYRQLADSITDILFELDHDLRHTHWNKASEMFSGIPAEEAIGRSMKELFGASEEQSGREEIYKSVLRERRASSFETEVVAKGQKRALEINAYPSARGVSVVAKDVTDRKRSQIIMQKRFELMEYSAQHSLSELMQRTVDEVSELTGSTIGFFHFVQEDQKTLGMQTWSTSALKLFSVPLSEGTHLPLDRAGVWADAVRQRRPLIQNDYEALPQKKGFPQGHVPISREIVIPIIRNEKVMAIMGIGNKPQDYTSYDLDVAERLADYAWDITERKQMQVALETERNQLAKRVEERTADLSQANSNLARALRVKDEFLANMSHELRTPLNAILGLSESLGEQIAGPLNEKQQKYITTISESGHHLLSLINDILDLAKIEAGQITLDINKVDIQQVCQASLRMIKQLAQKKNQDVVLAIGPEVGLMWADERRLKQMIVNLLGNAVKFTPEHGKIGLEVHGDQVANKVTMTVWDTGIGIKEDDLARLFQPFVQLDSGLAREATGTGLGLALVAQMARLHGGSVSAVSEPGKGSRFSIILPWEPALAIDTSTRLRTTGKFHAIKPEETNKPTILLVEDTKEVVMMIRDYLELAGYKVAVARDGVEAIAQARLVHPDLILMDVMMPRMDGFEATRKLRSEPEFKYTPIVALTALAMPSDRERCLAAGMDEYISKPINLKALVRLIQSCLFGNEESKRK